MTNWFRSLKQWGIPLALAILAMVLGWQLRRPSDGASAHVTTITGVSSIAVTQNQQVFEVRRQPVGWINVRHPGWQLDSDYIDQWLLAIQRVSIVRPISRDARSEFGLVSPAMSIRLANAGQQVTTIKIGNRAPNGDIYILVNDSIYLADRESIRSIWKDEADFRDNRPFRKLVIGGTHLIRVFGLRGADPVLTLDRGKATGLWYLTSTTNMITESDRVSKLLGAIQSMSVFRYTPEPPGPVREIVLDGQRPARIRWKWVSKETAAIDLGGGEWGIVLPLFLRQIDDLYQLPMGERPISLDRFKFDKIEIETSQNRIVLTRNDVGHWRDGRNRIVTVPLHNFLAELQHFRTAKGHLKAGDRISLTVSSGNNTECFNLVKLDDSAIQIQSDLPRAAVMLNGDANGLWGKLHKLTVAR